MCNNFYLLLPTTHRILQRRSHNIIFFSSCFSIMKSYGGAYLLLILGIIAVNFVGGTPTGEGAKQDPPEQKNPVVNELIEPIIEKALPRINKQGFVFVSELLTLLRAKCPALPPAFSPALQLLHQFLQQVHIPTPNEGFDKLLASFVSCSAAPNILLPPSTSTVVKKGDPTRPTTTTSSRDLFTLKTLGKKQDELPAGTPPPPKKPTTHFLDPVFSFVSNAVTSVKNFFGRMLRSGKNKREVDEADAALLQRKRRGFKDFLDLFRETKEDDDKEVRAAEKDIAIVKEALNNGFRIYGHGCSDSKEHYQEFQEQAGAVLKYLKTLSPSLLSKTDSALDKRFMKELKNCMRLHI